MPHRSQVQPVADIAVVPTPARRNRWSAAGYGWLGFSALAIAVVAVTPYLTASLTDLSHEDNDFAATYARQASWVQVMFYMHITFGGVALVLSPAQLSARMRRRSPRVHRAIGRIVLVSIVVSGAGGAVLAPISQAGAIGTAGFGALAVLWVTTAALAFTAIRRGDVRRHRQWAIRMFSLTYAGVMLRLWLGVLLIAQIAGMGVSEDVAFDRAYQLMPFLSWVPNLLVAEHLLRWLVGKAARTAVPAGPSVRR